jgi:hypothetical protein
VESLYQLFPILYMVMGFPVTGPGIFYPRLVSSRMSRPLLVIILLVLNILPVYHRYLLHLILMVLRILPPPS